MKKLIIIAALIFVAGFCFGQALQKGNLLGVHVMTITLKPNVTMDQFKTFFINKVIPEYEKQFQDVKGYLVNGVRGENKNSFGIVWLFETEKARDRYFNMDETTTDLGKSIVQKLDPISKELEKLGTYTTKYTDWVVQ
jgi:F0F1-type ATP synthase membrane subunit c/vacuolar-type H+-ATPase subunit K